MEFEKGMKFTLLEKLPYCSKDEFIGIKGPTQIDDVCIDGQWLNETTVDERILMWKILQLLGFANDEEMVIPDGTKITINDSDFQGFGTAELHPGFGINNHPKVQVILFQDYFVEEKADPDDPEEILVELRA